jgi:hypothetical protein
MKKLYIPLLGFILVVAGCDQLMMRGDKKAKEESKAPAAPKQDALETVVIQRGKMESGRKAANKLREVSAQRDNDLNEVMGGD